MEGWRSPCTARGASSVGTGLSQGMLCTHSRAKHSSHGTFSGPRTALPTLTSPHRITFKQRHKHEEDSPHLPSHQAHRPCPAPFHTAIADVRARPFPKNTDPALTGPAKLHCCFFGLSKFRSPIIQIMSIYRENKTQRCTKVQMTIFSNLFSL